MNYDKLAGCGPLRGLAPLGPLKSIQIYKKKKNKNLRKRIPTSVLGHMKKVWIFELFQNHTPPGGVNSKKYFEIW